MTKKYAQSSSDTGDESPGGKKSSKVSFHFVATVSFTLTP